MNTAKKTFSPERARELSLLLRNATSVIPKYPRDLNEEERIAVASLLQLITDSIPLMKIASENFIQDLTTRLSQDIDLLQMLGFDLTYDLDSIERELQVAISKSHPSNFSFTE